MPLRTDQSSLVARLLLASESMSSLGDGAAGNTPAIMSNMLNATRNLHRFLLAVWVASAIIRRGKSRQ
jgi:hypothetical protein